MLRGCDGDYLRHSVWFSFGGSVCVGRKVGRCVCARGERSWHLGNFNRWGSGYTGTRACSFGVWLFWDDAIPNQSSKNFLVILIVKDDTIQVGETVSIKMLEY